MFLLYYVSIVFCDEYTDGYFVIESPKGKKHLMVYDNGEVRGNPRKMPLKETDDDVLQFIKNDDEYAIKFVRTGSYLCKKGMSPAAYTCPNIKDNDTRFEVEDNEDGTKKIKTGDFCLVRIGRNVSADSPGDYWGFQPCEIERPNDWLIKKANFEEKPKKKKNKKKNNNKNFEFGTGSLINRKKAESDGADNKENGNENKGLSPTISSEFERPPDTKDNNEIANNTTGITDKASSEDISTDEISKNIEAKDAGIENEQPPDQNAQSQCCFGNPPTCQTSFCPIITPQNSQILISKKDSQILGPALNSIRNAMPNLILGTENTCLSIPKDGSETTNIVRII